MPIQEKHEQLKRYLRELGDVAVAFSGGVDSTFLLKTAHEVLDDKAIAVTAHSRLYPERELREAVSFCEKHGIRHFICEFDELEIDGFTENPLNRCYLCKSELFVKIWAIARKQNISHVAEGSNIDDDSDYRPGHIAIEEHGVKSPLRYAKLTKDEIRVLSKDMGLPTWNKQSFACLSSRFPYGESITTERLSMIDKAEQYLLDAGFKQVRVRYHSDLARIETDQDGFRLLEDKTLRKKICDEFKQIGFTYVASDLLGYRTGSMNETINQ